MQTITVTLVIPWGYADDMASAVVSYGHPTDKRAMSQHLTKSQVGVNTIEMAICNYLLNRYETHLCNPHGWRMVYNQPPVKGEHFVAVYEYDFETHGEIALADARSVMEQYRDKIGADPGQSPETIASTIYAIFGNDAPSDIIEPKVLDAAKIVYDNIMEG